MGGGGLGGPTTAMKLESIEGGHLAPLTAPNIVAAELLRL